MSEKELTTQQAAPVAWGEGGVELRSLDDAYRFAKYVAASGMAPGLKNEVAVVVALQTGMELGFSPMRSLQVVHVIKGRPTIAVEAMAAKVEADGVLEPGTKLGYRYLKEGDDIGCQAYSQPRGGKLIESEAIWLSDFKHLQSNDNWKRYPKRMLKARAVGWHIRDNYAASVNNLVTSEEMYDEAKARPQAERDITPPKHHPLLATPEVVEEEVKEEVPAVDEPVEAEIIPECEHPMGFAPSESRPEPHCIECGAEEDEE